MTKQEEIIEKLKFTMAMCEYDPLTGDIIERCFMNDMTRTTYDGCKAAIEFIEKHQYVHDKCKKCIEFSEFKKQSCEDCISREQTLKAFAEKCGGECACCKYNGSGYDNAENCKLIKSIPSVTPTRPKGEWIPMQVSSGRDSWKCSICGRRARGKLINLPFCHCGADMRESEE